MTYIEIADVRRASGVPSTLITDTQITAFIATVEKEMAKWVNTAFVPTEEIDVRDGSGSEHFYVKRKPLLCVRELITNDTTITPSSLQVYKDSGKVRLGEDSETGTHILKAQTIRCRYLYGLLERTSSTTTLDADSTAGSSVALSVVDESSFAENYWVEIYGIDGKQEVGKVTATATGEVTVDELAFDHESGSKIVILHIPEFIKRYMEIEAAIGCALNAIGATYTFNASYGLGEFNVVKGVPYTHWRESFEKLVKERDSRKSKINIQFHMGMS